MPPVNDIGEPCAEAVTSTRVVYGVCPAFGTSLCQAAGIREVTESWSMVR